MDSQRSSALELAHGLPANPKNLERVAAATSADAARWAFQQWELRSQAQSKFTQATTMLFTREALEQATSEAVAHYHASKYPGGVLVADATTGIGGDLCALAQRGPAVGFELDEERAAYARHNLATYGLNADVLKEDALPRLHEFDYVWADPSRRLSGRRTLDPSEFLPDPNELAKKCKSAKLLGMKLSPLLTDEYLESFGGSLEFVSSARECKEAVVWLSQGADRTERLAVHIESGERLSSGEAPEQVEHPRAFLFEADPAAIRAHALRELCSRHNLSALADANGYLTGEEPTSSPWLVGFEVLGVPTSDRKALNKQLRDLGAGTVIVKSRYPSLRVEQLAAELKGKAGRELVVVAYPVGRSLRFCICHRI